MGIRMPRSIGALALLLLGISVARGEGVLEFDIWMQQIDHRSQDVLRHIQRDDRAAALADARELAKLYRKMEDFYEQRGRSDDAVLASFVGRDEAEQAAYALEKGRLDEAFRQASAISRDCRNCHIQYKPMHN